MLPALFKGYLVPENPRVLELLVPLWPRIAGKAVAAHSRPVSFELGSLTVATSDPNWAKQLRGLSEQIKVEVNSFWGRALVNKVRIIEQKNSRLPRPIQADPSTLNPSGPPGLEGKVGGAPALPLPDGAARLDPEIRQILARSYAKYFDRTTRNPL